MPQDINDKRNVSGGVFAGSREGFSVLSENPGIEFDLTEVQPLIGVYIDLNDQLLVTVNQTSNGGIVTVNARILGLDGNVHPFQFQVTSFSGAVNTQRFQLMEGFLISCTAQNDHGNSGNNFAYVELALVRSPFGQQSKYMQLWAGLTYTGMAFGYPSSVVQRPTDGPGTVLSTSQGAPAAGADIQLVVPPLTRWRLVSLRATLTTAVAVANRLVSITIDDGANIVAESVSNFTQAASIVNTYNAFDSAPYVNVPFNLRTQQPLPSNIFLGPGFRINTSTANIQAADQWSALRVLVQQWPEMS